MPGGATLPPRKYWPWFLLVVLVNYLLVSYLFPQPNAPVTVPYTVFREQVAKDNVIAIYSRGTTIEGRFRSPVTWPTPEEVKEAGQQAPRTALDRRLLPPPRTSVYFSTELPAFFDRGLEDFLIRNKVEISAVPIQQGGLWNTLLLFAPALLIVGFYVWMYRRMAGQGGAGMGGMFGIGRSKAKRYDTTDAANRVTFDDVAGIDEAEAELVEIVDFLKAPDKYTRLGGTAPKGVLLGSSSTCRARRSAAACPTSASPSAATIRCARPSTAAEGLPMNLGFLGKGNASRPGALIEQIEAGAMGPEAARGLGHHARVHRLLPERRRPVRRAGRHPHPHAQRIGLRGGHARRLRGPHRSR